MLDKPVLFDSSTRALDPWPEHLLKSPIALVWRSDLLQRLDRRAEELKQMGRVGARQHVTPRRRCDVVAQERGSSAP